MKENKYPKHEEIESKKSIVFSFHWVGNRIPERITLPFERVVKVSNMRNGQIVLENGMSGTYKRFMDNNKTQERAIIIELELE